MNANRKLTSATGAEHEKVGKGITLNIEEIQKLKELLDGIDLEVLEKEYTVLIDQIRNMCPSAPS